MKSNSTESASESGSGMDQESSNAVAIALSDFYDCAICGSPAQLVVMKPDLYGHSVDIIALCKADFDESPYRQIELQSHAIRQ